MPNSNIPSHLGIIIDGNRRWAKENGLPTLEGHRRGLENLKVIVDKAFEVGVEYISVYIFSTENWNRTKEEVSYLMDLVVKGFANDAKTFIKKNIKIDILGSEVNIPKKVLKAIKQVQEDSKNNTAGTLAFCFNYSGLNEITDAVKKIVKSGILPEEVTNKTISENLYNPEIPDVDFMIRTSGEQRLSNFMLARMAYAELYFTEKNWPEFKVKDFEGALTEYAMRQRRFGK